MDDVSSAWPPVAGFRIVGESGSGKTTLGLALAGLLPATAPGIVSGSIRYQGAEVVGLSPPALGLPRGKEVWSFPDAKTALDPVRTIGSQIGEAGSTRPSGGQPSGGSRRRPAATSRSGATGPRASAFACTPTSSPAASVNGP